MRRILTNPYSAILLAPLVSFLLVVNVGVSPDPISLVSRVYVFALFAYVGARYVGRAPSLMWNGDMRAEARNISGWALVILGSMMTQVYAWLYIVYDRPEWLSSQYWSPSFVVLIATGLTLVASSVPRFPPFGVGGQGLSVIASFVVGFSSAMFLVLLQQIGHVWMILKAIFAGAVHAL